MPMILQTDPRLLPEINKYGCYFMSICFFLNKYKKVMWTTDKINDFYKLMVNIGNIEADDDFTTANPIDAEIIKPDKIFQSGGLIVEYLGHCSKDYICDSDKFEILKFVGKNGSHFVCGDGKGNVAYDPYGDSNSVRFGELHSKRVFRRI